MFCINKLRRMIMRKKLKLSNIEVKNLKNDDFIFLMIDPEELSEMAVEDLQHWMEIFRKKIPSSVDFALLPYVKSIESSTNKDLIKLFIDTVIQTYNNHFNEIYLPYKN